MLAQEQEAGNAVEVFKSPRHKLVRFFRESQKKWKGKAMQRLDLVRNLRRKVNDVQESRLCWRKKAQDAEAANKALQEHVLKLEAELAGLRAQAEDAASKKA
jgi:hypothetical protein